MSDSRIQRLARSVAANPGDVETADRLACALVRSGQGPKFVDYLSPPGGEDAFSLGQGAYGRWDGPRFGPEGRFRLSIKAGSFQYSAPRQSVLAATDYQEWEVAIVDYSGGGLVSIPGNPDYAGMPYREHWDGEDCVGPYVPALGVQAIFDWMTLNHGRPQHPRVFALED